MMLKRILTTIILFTGLTTFGQNNSRGKSDPEARKILDKVSSQFKSYKTAAADFTLKVYNSQGKLEAARSGKILMKGDKYKISTAGREIYNNGSTVYTFDEDINEVQITNFNPNGNMLTPQSLFTDFYEKDFLYKLNDKSVNNGKSLSEIEFTPLDKTLPYFKVVIHIDNPTNRIVSAKVFEKNGNRYVYTISNFRKNVNMADGQFTFNTKAHPGVEVIDLR